MREITFEVEEAIPELGAEVGDLIVCDPQNARTPVLVVKRHTIADYKHVVHHINQLRLVASSDDPHPGRPSSQPPPPLRLMEGGA